MKIELLGDITHSLDPTVKALGAVGISAEINAVPYDDAPVVVAVSCLQGLSSASLSTLDSWNGKRVRLIGILLTEVHPDMDADLLELVFLETITQLIPGESPDHLADSVAEFRSNAPDLAQQIQDSANGSAPTILMQVDKAAFEQYAASFEKQGKPWWKFW